MTTMPTRQQIEDAAPLEFEPAPVYYYPQFSMSATVQHRGRTITVIATDMNAEQFCDLLDKRFGPPSVNPTPAPTSGAIPTCQNRNCSKYSQPMEPSQHGSGYYCKGRDEATGNPKGYCKSTVK